VAWQPLGWQPVAFAEIEPFPCAVLAHHYPDVPNLGDVTEITDEQIEALGLIDIVVGGSPCQDLSCAGKRAGLAGERSSLFHEQIRIFHAARTLCGARWLVWENVPGAFSSNQGRDFAVVLGAMAGCHLAVPADGWGREGMALGEYGLVEWSVLDAQWFGLAQRRKRVFAVLDTGNWQDRPPILLERDSLRGDTAPRRESGKNIAEASASGARRGGRSYIPDTSMCLTARGVGKHDAKQETLIFQSRGGNSGEAGLIATSASSETPDVAMCLNAGAMGRRDAESETFVVHGTQDPDTLTEPAHTLGRNQGQENVVYTLTERGRDGGHALEYRCDGTANALLTPNGGRAGMGVGTIAHQSTVRRLTPRECERLQGFPDDYLRIAWRGKPADQCPDGPRYRALGNSMAVPVMRWIGRQIDAATDFEHLEKVA